MADSKLLRQFVALTKRLAVYPVINEVNEERNRRHLIKVRHRQAETKRILAKQSLIRPTRPPRAGTPIKPPTDLLASLGWLRVTELVDLIRSEVGRSYCESARKPNADQQIGRTCGDPMLHPGDYHGSLDGPWELHGNS